MSYLPADVFLDTQTARTLYDQVAAKQPVMDFHTHLPVGEILEDRRFDNLWELWLQHDHYKWRLMRACGVSECFITGEASPWQKFAAFAAVMPLSLGNPVHHWAHLELQRVFGIHMVLSKDTAAEVWRECNQRLREDASLSVRGLLQKFGVTHVCTTDDPTDDLVDHALLAVDASCGVKVLPTFRPDGAMAVDQPARFIDWVAKAGGLDSFDQLMAYLRGRHDCFDERGCRLSDHGLSYCPRVGEADREQLDAIMAAALAGEAASPEQWDIFAGAVLAGVAQWNTHRGWAMQLHLGPWRGVNSRMAETLGADTGFDSMGSWRQTPRLIALLDGLAGRDALPKTIVYHLNPDEAAAMCCALQNFQDDTVPGKVQYGPAWWHWDHVRGIGEQLDLLASLGALGTAVGMLTDSRSFTSYVRHEYYRRLLCQYLGRAVEAGTMPADEEALAVFVRGLCYHNAERYFNFV